MAIKSPKRKGRAGEREWVRLLNAELGTYYTRTPASGGGPEVKGDLMPRPFSKACVLDKFYHEVKRRQSLNVLAALAQAIEDCRGRVPYVAWRRDEGEWTVTMRGTDFINLLKEIGNGKE